MEQTLERPTEMARRPDVTVKIDQEVAAQAKMVAASRGVSLAEYVSEVLRPIVAQHLEEETARRLTNVKRPKGDA